MKKFWYIVVLVASLFATLFCLAGVINCLIRYFECKCSTQYLSVAATFLVGLLACLIQFLILLKGNISAKRNQIIYTTSYISNNRKELLPLFMDVPELNKETRAIFKCHFDLNQNQFVFENNDTSLKSYFMEMYKTIKNDVILLGHYIGNENVIEYRKLNQHLDENNRNKKFSYDLTISNKLTSNLNKTCNLLDSFFENYFNNLFQENMISVYLETVINEIVDRVSVFILLIRKRDMEERNSINGSDWRYLYRYIKEKFGNKVKKGI